MGARLGLVLRDLGDNGGGASIALSTRAEVTLLPPFRIAGAGSETTGSVCSLGLILCFFDVVGISCSQSDWFNELYKILLVV